jgi:hypothetical protein
MGINDHTGHSDAHRQGHFRAVAVKITGSIIPYLIVSLGIRVENQNSADHITAAHIHQSNV